MAKKKAKAEAEAPIAPETPLSIDLKDIPEEQFQQELTRRNLTAADMREGLRREFRVFRDAAWLRGAAASGSGAGFATQVDLAALFAEQSIESVSLREIARAAGNGNNNLDSIVYRGLFNRTLRDSGAILVGASNAVNLTDGLDGLAIGPAPAGYGLCSRRRCSTSCTSSPAGST